HYPHLSQMDSRSVIFSLFWLILINITSYYFTKLVLKQENEYRKRLSSEQEIRNKESNKATLIENMELVNQYRNKQHHITKSNEKLLLFFNHTRSLNKTIPSDLLVGIFSFALLFLSNVFIGSNLLI